MKRFVSGAIAVLFLVFFLVILTSCGGGGSGGDSSSTNTSDSGSEQTYDIRGTWKSDPVNGQYGIYKLEGTPTGGNLSGQFYGGDYPWHYEGTYIVDGNSVEFIYYCVEIGKKEPLLMEGHFVDNNTIKCDYEEAIDSFGNKYSWSNCAEMLRRMEE